MANNHNEVVPYDGLDEEKIVGATPVTWDLNNQAILRVSSVNASHKEEKMASGTPLGDAIAIELLDNWNSAISLTLPALHTHKASAGLNMNGVSTSDALSSGPSRPKEKQKRSSKRRLRARERLKKNLSVTEGYNSPDDFGEGRIITQPGVTSHRQDDSDYDVPPLEPELCETDAVQSVGVESGASSEGVFPSTCSYRQPLAAIDHMALDLSEIVTAPNTPVRRPSAQPQVGFFGL